MTSAIVESALSAESDYLRWNRLFVIRFHSFCGKLGRVTERAPIFAEQKN